MKRRFHLAILLVFLLTSPGLKAQTDLGASDRLAIRGVIENQLAAFQRDDGAAAFGYASPDIQAMFGTADIFLAMVRQGYAAVYRPRAVNFGGIVGESEAPVQLVHVVGPDGAAQIAAYEMIRLPDGSWRINGCVLLPEPGRTT